MGQEEHNTTTCATTCTDHHVNHMTNLSEDVANASNQPHSQVDRSEKSVSCEMCEIHKARLLQDCSSGAPPTPMTGCYDFWRAWRPTPGQRPGTSSTARSPCRVSFVSIVAVKVAISSFAATSPVWLALRSSSSFWAGHQLLQNANDLAALWCVRLTGTARQERKQRGTIIIGNPGRRAFEPMATSTESNTSGYLTKRVMVTFAVYPRLFSHHF